MNRNKMTESGSVALSHMLTAYSVYFTEGLIAIRSLRNLDTVGRGLLQLTIVHFLC